MQGELGEEMPDWIVTIAVPAVAGSLGVLGGVMTKRFTKKYNPEYLRYQDEKKQADCQHTPVEGHGIKAFCEKCKKTLTDEDLARQRMLDCKHNIQELNNDEYYVTYHCPACGRVYVVPRSVLS